MSEQSLKQLPGLTIPTRTGKVPAPVVLAAIVLLCPLLAYQLATGNEDQVMVTLLAVPALIAVVTRPLLGLLLFVGLLYTRPEDTFPELAGLHLTLIVSLTALVGMLVRTAVERESFVRSPLILMLAGFLLAAIGSSLGNGNSAAALQDIGKFVVLVILVLNLVQAEGKYRTLISTILIFTAYLACYSIYLYFSGHGLSYTDASGHLVRAEGKGIFSDPNDLAATMAAGLAFGLARLKEPGRLSRGSYAALCGMYLWAILLSDSRSGLLALLVVSGLAVLSHLRKKGVALALAAVLVCVVWALAPARMTNLDSQEASANQRFWFWYNGVKQFQLNPVLGIGYNQFPEVNGGMTAHNSFVLCFSELGIVGYFFWMGCLYFALLPVPSPPEEDPEGKKSAETPRRSEVTAARSALIGYLVACFFISRTYTPILYLLLSLPIAAQLPELAAYWKSGKHGKPRSLPTGADCFRILVLCGGSILLIKIIEEQLR